jgi:hypothetical protein
MGDIMPQELESEGEIIYHVGTGRSMDWDLREDSEIEESLEDLFDIEG